VFIGVLNISVICSEDKFLGRLVGLNCRGSFVCYVYEWINLFHVIVVMCMSQYCRVVHKKSSIFVYMKKKCGYFPSSSSLLDRETL
jgi:hypothetical protein